MKRTLLLSGLLGLTVGMTVQAADGFTIKGELPGLKAGTEIKLVSQERGQHGEIATATAQPDGSFILTGSVASPSLCELRIKLMDDGSLDKAVRLMVENVDMTVKAAHIDSVAPGFCAGTSGLMKEKNVSVSGGRAQDEYKEYTDFMFPYIFAVKQAHYNLYWDENRDRSEEGKARMEKEYDAANIQEAAARKRFINGHPSYGISGRFLVDELNSPFTFTAAELSEIENKFAALTDSVRLSQVKRGLDYARQYQRGAMYTDFAALDSLGNERKISDFRAPDKYVMIDFWASWCGPCRASIPHVRELYNKYGDRLEIISVSVDSAEKPWRKAMADEQMEWTQLWLDKNRVDPVSKAYQLSGIPFMLVLNPEGNMIYAGHDPKAVSATLADSIK